MNDLSAEQSLRLALLHTAQRLLASGLNRGTSGNVSVRCGDGFLVTPSAMPVEQMTPDSMVEMTLQGEVIGGGKPSSEWRFHRDILQQRSDLHAVVHTHSTFATTLACLRLDVPAVHYMVAMAGGSEIRCAPYALFGTQALSDHALEALRGQKACLLANHGMIAAGRDLEEAYAVAEETEFLCELYWRAAQVASPHILTPQQMAEVREQFKGYKKQEPI